MRSLHQFTAWETLTFVMSPLAKSNTSSLSSLRMTILFSHNVSLLLEAPTSSGMKLSHLCGHTCLTICTQKISVINPKIVHCPVCGPWVWLTLGEDISVILPSCDQICPFLICHELLLPSAMSYFKTGTLCSSLVMSLRHKLESHNDREWWIRIRRQIHHMIEDVTCTRMMLSLFKNVFSWRKVVSFEDSPMMRFVT